jgi:1-acyl-sn-glycerol-3-phosphate acyltransferase
MVPRRGTPATRAVSRWILRLFGWQVAGELPNLPRFVIAVAPHTSNWDFLVGILARGALGLQARFLGKDSLFRPPFGWLMRALGGTPVDRSAPAGVVEETIRIILDSDRFVLALAPEGTRKLVSKWKSGFIRVAHGARIPVVLAVFDFGKRTVRLGPTLWMTGDVDADMKRVQACFAGVRGRRPALFSLTSPEHTAQESSKGEFLDPV